MATDPSPLCCCEFRNLHGQRTHILAFCCECEELDHAVDQCLKGNRVPRDKLNEFVVTVFQDQTITVFGQTVALDNTITVHSLLPSQCSFSQDFGECIFHFLLFVNLRTREFSIWIVQKFIQIPGLLLCLLHLGTPLSLLLECAHSCHISCYLSVST
ncbi:protein-cysteine S-acyltransferase [Desmophyllum pertusum]|uniref:Protein-cysteine S-acyltransferase n=1 Tax=Desmophyllum pertusum TaxID=174260 RepID=A0A9X0DBJ3_9CNID|nr:protein-cysteine S-acyltransferase [Desmophyllum pertusum]